MTTRQFQIIFFAILGLCILTIVLSFTSFDFIELDTATNWTMKYFALPILIVMAPSCYFIYLKFIRQHETKEYKSKVWTQLRTIFRILILTLAMTGIFRYKNEA
jgi:amino acid transporter